MKIAVVGGGLQGVEAAYLAHKAGWNVLLIDKRSHPPASGLSDEFIQLDVTRIDDFADVAKTVDIVIPANENEPALQALHQWSLASDTPLAFDIEAYRISSSKIKSDRLFAGYKVPAPLPYPACGFPVIAKPSESSGSRGVRFFQNQQEMNDFFVSLHSPSPSPSLPPPGWVIQQYLEGPSYSIEIVGSPGNYLPLQVTDLDMDDVYDCKRVNAPTSLPVHLIEQFEKIAVTLAEAVQLHGLMDVEVILHQGELKVLEIDARLPSQTPTAVYHSSGCNILSQLADLWVSQTGNLFVKNLIKPARDRLGRQEFTPLPKLFNRGGEKSVIYEHIQVRNGRLDGRGEHIISEAGPLKSINDFFGADEAITNYSPHVNDWVATLVFIDSTPGGVLEKQNRAIDSIKKQFHLK